MTGLESAVAFVPSHDLARSRAFYEGTLGLEVVDVNDYAVVLRSGPTMIRLTAAEGWSPQPFTVLGWTVSDIESAVAALVDAGAQFRHYDGMKQDELGVWTTPGGDKVAWFVDPDANVLSLTEFAAR
jgi:catechol 2,3-dioxygenase-like lactoylglutathione lyase family enzyme